MLPCYFKVVFNIDCPGCGLQRSLLLLFKGNLVESFLMYPPLIPVLLVFGAYFFNEFFPFVNNKKVFNKLGIALLAIVIFNWVMKIFL